MGREIALTDMTDTYQEAAEALSFAKNHQHKTFITYSELGAERLWLNTDRSLLNKFVSDKIGPLLRMEPEYLKTMQAFLANNQSHKQTAEEMHIHPNTLAYRLKKSRASCSWIFPGKKIGLQWSWPSRSLIF